MTSSFGMAYRALDDGSAAQLAFDDADAAFLS